MESDMDTLLLMLLPLLPFAGMYLLARKVFGPRILHTIFRVIRGPMVDLGKFVLAEGRHGNGHRVANKSRAAKAHRRFPLGRSILIYLLITTAYVSLKLGLAMRTPMDWAVSLLAYLMAGLALNRLVLARMVWHDVYNTLSAVARAKLVAMLAWPLAYPLLFAQIIIVRYL